MARQARVILGVVRGACTGIVCDLMLLIEGCQPDELPERMIGGARWPACLPACLPAWLPACMPGCLPRCWCPSWQPMLLARSGV